MSSGAYTHNIKAVVPWKDLTMLNDKYLGKGSLPADTILCEPSKLQQFAVINMWNYWKKKERLGQPTITFIHAKQEDKRHAPEGRDKKGKKKAVEFMDPSRSSSPTTVPGSPKQDHHPIAGPSGTRPSLTPDPGPDADHSEEEQLMSGPDSPKVDKKGKRKWVEFINPSRSCSPTTVPGSPKQDYHPIAGPSGTSPSPAPDPSPDADDSEEEQPMLDPDCPKAHMLTKKGRFQYLKLLSDNNVYQTMLRSMQRIKVFSLITS